jgi:NAD(P)-dependent dehydrogenase (short-subunit alcohol dehydrogenase family)
MSAKKVVITGSRGIAAGLARALSDRGDLVYLIGGEAQDSDQLQNDCPGVIGFSSIDLRDEGKVEAAFATANTDLVGITDVIGIVGGSGRSFGDGSIETISKAAWDATLELNLSTAFLTAREAIRIFLRLGSGSLTLTSSVLATSPSPEFFKTHAYATAKSGINGLVTTLSAAYAQQGIRVNAVAPGLVATPMAGRAKDNPEIVEFTKKKQPFVGSQLSVDAIVSAYLYLLENKFVTGQVITVDGGWTSVTNV